MSSITFGSVAMASIRLGGKSAGYEVRKRMRCRPVGVVVQVAQQLGQL